MRRAEALQPRPFFLPLFTGVRGRNSRNYSAAPTLCGKDFLCKDWLEIDVARQRVQPHRARPSRLAGYLSLQQPGPSHLTFSDVR